MGNFSLKPQPADASVCVKTEKLLITAGLGSVFCVITANNSQTELVKKCVSAFALWRALNVSIYDILSQREQ